MSELENVRLGPSNFGSTAPTVSSPPGSAPPFTLTVHPAISPMTRNRTRVRCMMVLPSASSAAVEADLDELSVIGVAVVVPHEQPPVPSAGRPETEGLEAGMEGQRL